MAVALDLHVLADGHGPGPGDAAEVVAAEVDEHHVLGALLRVALELLGEQRRPRGRRRRAAACRRSGGSSAGRPRPGAAAPGDAPTTSNVGRPDEEQVRARVDPAQRAVEPDAVERASRSPGPSGGRTTGAARARPGSPRRPRSRPWRPRRRGCTRRARGSSRPGRRATARPRPAAGAVGADRRPRPARRSRRRSGARVRSSASKIASSAIR